MLWTAPECKGQLRTCSHGHCRVCGGSGEWDGHLGAQALATVPENIEEYVDRESRGHYVAGPLYTFCRLLQT